MFLLWGAGCCVYKSSLTLYNFSVNLRLFPKIKFIFLKDRFWGLHCSHLDTHLAATKHPFAKKNYKKHLPSDLAWKLFPRKSPRCREKKKNPLIVNLGGVLSIPSKHDFNLNEEQDH